MRMPRPRLRRLPGFIRERVRRLPAFLRGLVRENWYRDVWLVLTTVVVLVALVQSQRAIDRQAEGRKIASAVTCSAISAVIDAGRATIASSGKIDPREFERNLEALGLPPRGIRAQQSRTAAQAYARLIARRVRDEAGLPGVVNPDGTLDCRRLRQVSNVGTE